MSEKIQRDNPALIKLEDTKNQLEQAMFEISPTNKVAIKVLREKRFEVMLEIELLKGS